MTTAIQKTALDKLRGRWVESGSLGEHDDDRPPHVFTDFIEPAEMTKAEAMALRGWLKERGLSEQEQMSVEDLLPGQFRITEFGDGIAINIDTDNEDFNPDRDVEHFPKPEGDIQRYFIKLHRDDFAKLQMEFLREGWFSREIGKGRGYNPQLGL